MKNKIFIVRSNKKAFGGAEIYLDRLKDEFTRQNINHQIINSKVPKFLFSWLRVIIFNIFICLTKKNKFYFSLDRISCPDIFRAGDGVHKKYIQITNQTILKPLNFLYCVIEKKAFNQAKHIIAISQMVKENILEHYGSISPDKITVVYNGINLINYDYEKSFISLSQEFNIKKSDSIILFVGSGYKRKGVEEFLKIISHLSDFHSNLKVFVVGKEKNIPYYLALRKHYNLEHIVIFTGPRNDVIQFYTIADIFLFPTHYEPFGNVILEAMNLKTAVITTKQCGGGELLNTSEIMDSPSDYSIVKRIKELLSDKISLEQLKNENFNKSMFYTIEKNATETMAIISKYV